MEKRLKNRRENDQQKQQWRRLRFFSTVVFTNTINTTPVEINEQRARDPLVYRRGKKHDRMGKCAPCSLYYGCVVKIEAFQLIFLFFLCASRAFVSCLQGLLFFLAVFPFPILPKWKIHSFNFHFSPIVSGGHIWASGHALYGRILQGEFDIFDYCDLIAPHLWQICSLTNNSENSFVTKKRRVLVGWCSPFFVIILDLLSEREFSAKWWSLILAHSVTVTFIFFFSPRCLHLISFVFFTRLVTVAILDKNKKKKLPRRIQCSFRTYESWVRL